MCGCVLLDDLFPVGRFHQRDLPNKTEKSYSWLQVLHKGTPNSGYLEGQGDLVNGLIRGITRVTIWVIGVSDLLTKSP